MSLTNNIDFSFPSGRGVSPKPLIQPTFTEKSNESAPLILRQLGRKLEENATAPKKLQVANTKVYTDYNHELKIIFNQIVSLVQQTTVEKKEISQLEGQLKQLETQLAEKKRNLSNSEVSKILDITQELQSVLSSLEDQIALQQKFNTLDNKLADSFESMQSSIYSDLHGWSPAAFKSLSESFDCMVKLIKLADPALDQKSLFSPEILQQLSSSTHTMTWGCREWFHETFVHFNEVLSVAENQWNEATRNFETSASIEDYTKMQLAGKQLLGMRKVMQEMDKALPNFTFFETRAQDLAIELQQKQLGFENRKIILNMKQHFAATAEGINESKKQLADKSSQLNNVIKDKKIKETLQQAAQTFHGIDLHPQIKKIISNYSQTEQDLTCYIATKHELSGILALPNSSKFYFVAHAFCKQEESRLNQTEDCPIDFNELVMAKMMQEGQPQAGIFSRLWNAVLPDPANWSDRTKYWVHVGGLSLQLLDQISKMGPKAKPQIQNQEPQLSKEQEDRVGKETAFLGNILKDRYGALQKDSNTFENLTKKAPEIRPILEALIKSHPQSFSDHEQRVIMSGYKTYRQDILLTGSEGDLDWITKLIPAPEFKAKSVSIAGLISPDSGKGMGTKEHAIMKANDQAVPRIAGTGPFLENTTLPVTKHEVMQELKQAEKTTSALDRQLRECNRLDYLSPKYPTTPKALHELREEIALMHRSLGETMMSKPAEQSPIPAWVEWSQSVQKQCHSLKHLENRIADAMMVYEEARAMSDYKSYMPLVEYGNKHMNLVKQHNIVKALGIDGVNVPMPQGVGSSRVLKFLQTYSPEIFEHWNAIRSIYANTKDKSSILENAELLSHLDKIDQGIEKAFLKAAEDDKAFDALGFTKQTKEWLNELKKKNAYLMVRSTGAEDSKQSANAGGNASISYVKPDRKELCQALGEVARSYFGTGSLQKRLNANLNPFEDELKVAVTTQELIGEEVGGAKDPKQIPISMVLFTNEPLFIGGEKFRTLRISATYGHGEGVVGNQGIASDTALLLVSAADPSKLYILYDNQEKPERLAPVRDSNGKISLQKIANSPEMAKSPVLNNDLITRLYEWGVIGEKFYEGDPTDMEIVIKGDTIYPVQARPINRPPLSASYLDLNKVSEIASSPIEKTLRTTMIVPGKASVVEITDPKEILIIDTLEMAEKQFKKGQHKLVVVGQSEPANSHPVVNFSALGMPCLFANDLDQARNLVKEIDSTHRLATCVQSATISLWDTSKGAINDFTSKGFVVHPAKIAISLPLKGELPQQTGIYAEAPDRVQKLIDQIGTATSHAEALNALQALKKEGWMTDLQTKINELKVNIATQTLLENTIQPIVTAAESLQNNIQASIAEIEAVLKNPSEAGRLEFLIRVKDLQTLLFQKPESSAAIAQQSLLSIQESFAAAKTLIDYQNQLPHQAHFADVLLDGTQAPLDKAFDTWKSFLLKLETVAQNNPQELSSAQTSQFKSVLNTMRQTNVLPSFMMFFFPQMNTNNSVDTVHAIINLMPAAEQPIIEQLLARNKEIQQLRNDIDQIANPKAYSETQKRLQTLVENFSPAKQAWLSKENWDATSPLTRSMAIQSMNECVDLYDTAIKTMKASPEIKSDVERTQKFKEMLGPYFDLLNSWAKETVGAKGFTIHPEWPLDKYLNTFNEIFLNLPDSDPDQLSKSNFFKVNTIILNSGTKIITDEDAYGHYANIPKTLEDFFTSIHQNLIVTTSTLTKSLLPEEQIKKSFLPDILQAAFDDSKKQIVDTYNPNDFVTERTLVDGRMGNVQLVEIDVTAQEIMFNYNLPLRDHAGKYSVIYDRQTNKTFMQVQFVSFAFQGRWRKCAERANLLDAAGILPLTSKAKFEHTGFSSTWDVSDKDHLNRALKEFHTEAWLSFSPFGTTTDIPEFVDELFKKGNLKNIIEYAFKNDLDPSIKRSLSNEIIGKLLTQGNAQEFSEHLIPILIAGSHPITNDFLDLLLLRVTGGDIEKGLLNIPENNRALISQIFKDLYNEKLMNHLQNILFMQNEENHEKLLGIAQAARKIDGFNKIVDLTIENSKSADPYKVVRSLQLFGVLIEDDSNILEALNAAIRGVQEEEMEILQASVGLWLKLTSKAIPYATTFASAGISNIYEYVRFATMKLLGIIIDKNQITK